MRSQTTCGVDAPRGWKYLLIGLLVLVPSVPLSAQTERRVCDNASTGLVPLIDLGTGIYEGIEGGLYPGGVNSPPQDHLEVGLRLGDLIVPRNSAGEADETDGVIAFLSVGVSNTRVEFDTFIELADGDPSTNPQVVLVNGAQTGVPVGPWADPASRVWEMVDSELTSAGVSHQQVQAAWIKLPGGERGLDPFPNGPLRYSELLVEAVRNLKQRFPNLHLAYLSSRIYGGYTPEGEPVAYQNGYGVRFAIEQQLAGRGLAFDPEAGGVTAPWMGWGPYLWADGTTPRSDGLTWLCDDFRPDGLHPSDGARSKVANLLLTHLQTDPTSRLWFLAPEFRSSPPTTRPPPSESTTTSMVTTTTEGASTTSSLLQEATTTSTSNQEEPVVDQSRGVPGWLALLGTLAGLALGIWIGGRSHRRIDS